MVKNLINSNIQLYFYDITYHCIQPTFCKFELIVLSGFNLKDKKTHIYFYAYLLMKNMIYILKYFRY